MRLALPAAWSLMAALLSLALLDVQAQTIANHKPTYIWETALPFSPISPFPLVLQLICDNTISSWWGKAPDRPEGLKWIHGGWIANRCVSSDKPGDQWVICPLSHSRASGEAANQWLSRSRTSCVQYKVINASPYGWTRLQDQWRIPIAPWPEPDGVGSMQQGLFQSSWS
ncbi:thrombospondin type-1 domain-containing protein 7A [Tachysurus ichikawai]